MMQLGIWIGWAIIGVAILGAILYQGIHSARQWINDEKRTNVLAKHLGIIMNKEKDASILESTIFAIIAVAVIGGLASVVWPLTVLVALVFAALYCLRGFTRFKKRVDAVLNMKTAGRREKA